jgi:hypothetical protein
MLGKFLNSQVPKKTRRVRSVPYNFALPKTLLQVISKVQVREVARYNNSRDMVSD